MCCLAHHEDTREFTVQAKIHDHTVKLKTFLVHLSLWFICELKSCCRVQTDSELICFSLLISTDNKQAQSQNVKLFLKVKAALIQAKSKKYDDRYAQSSANTDESRAEGNEY